MTLGVPSPDDDRFRLWLGDDLDDRPVFAAPFASVIGTGAPRTGKTRGIAIPAVLGYPGTVVVVSVRGDLHAQTAAARATRGPVAVFDPAGTVPKASNRVGWNLLGRCRDFQIAIDIAQSLADQTVPTGGGGRTDWMFWSALGRKLLAPLLFAAASNGYTLEDVVRWAKTQEEFEVRSLLQAIPDERCGGKALQMIDSVWSLEDRTRASVYATTDAMVSAFEAPALAAALQDGIDVERFIRTEGSTLYVVAPAARQAVYAPVVTSLIGAALDAAVTKAEDTNEPAHVLVVLDEAGNVGRIPGLQSRATTSMGFGITMVSLFHDVSQIVRTYGPEDAQTIIGAHEVRMTLRGVDPVTAATFDQLIGEVPDPSLPLGRGIGRLRCIPPGHAIVSLGGDDPKLVKLPTFDNPLMWGEFGV